MLAFPLHHLPSNFAQDSVARQQNLETYCFLSLQANHSAQARQCLSFSSASKPCARNEGHDHGKAPPIPSSDIRDSHEVEWASSND